MIKQEKYLHVVIILLITAIVLRITNKSLYIIYNFMLIISIYLIMLYIIKPRTKKGWVLFGVGIIIVDFIYLILPMIAIGFTFITTGKVLGYSYLSKLMVMLHIVLTATWSIWILICFTSKLQIKKLFVLIFAGLHFLVYTAFDTSIKEVKYVVDSPMIDAEENPILIAHISDLHSTIFSGE